MMKLFMDNLFVVVSIAFIVACATLLVIVSRFRRMRAVTIQRERERALEQDAIHMARAKLKFRNILGKQGQKSEEDPLWDLYRVDVPKDCRPG